MSKKYCIAGLVSLFLSLSLFAQDYVVQVAAFSENVPMTYFTNKDVQGVYLEKDHNLIRRYFVGPYVDEVFAKKVEMQIRRKGFKYARVVNLTEQKEKCALSCSPATPGDYVDDGAGVVGVSDLYVRNLFFDFDRSFLRPASTDQLDKLYTLLLENPNYNVELHAHTDWIGSSEYNDALSMRRGYKARNYLTNKGISKSRLSVRKWGENDPIARNQVNGQDSPEGRQLNRRVELRIVDSDGQILWDRVEEISVPLELKVNK